MFGKNCGGNRYDNNEKRAHGKKNTGGNHRGEKRHENVQHNARRGHIAFDMRPL